MNLFMNIMLTILPIYVLIVPKGGLTKSIVRNADKREMGMLEKCLCYVPVYNSYLIRKSLHGSSPIMLVYSYIIGVVFTLNLAIRLFLYQNEGLLLIMTAVMLVVLASIWITEAFVVSEATALFYSNKMIPLSILIPPLASALLVKHVDKHFRKYKDRIEGTFDGKKNRELSSS